MAWQYHLAQWKQVIEPEGPVWTPDIPAASFRAIDLRSSNAQNAVGPCLVATPDGLGGLPSGAVKFGVAPDDLIPPGVINALGNVLGISIDAMSRRVDDVLLHLLTDQGSRADAGKWNPIAPTSGRATKGKRYQEIYLGDLITRRFHSEFDLNHGSILISDDFNSLANGQDIGGRTPSPTNTPGNTWNEFAANSVEGDGAGKLQFAAVNDRAWIDTGEIDGRATLTWNGNSADNRGRIYTRSTGDPRAGTSDNYETQFFLGTDDLLLRKMVNSSETTLASNLNFTMSDSVDIKFEIEADGTSQRTLVDNVEELTATDSAVDGTTVGGSFAGFEHFKYTTGGASLDDFIFDDLAAVGGVRRAQLMTLGVS